MKFAINKSQPKTKAEGSINGKLLMTEEKGHMFVACTVIVMVYMIYIMKKSYYVGH